MLGIRRKPRPQASNLALVKKLRNEHFHDTGCPTRKGESR